MIQPNDFKEKKIVVIDGFNQSINDIKIGNNNIRLYREGKCVDQITCYSVICLFIIGEATVTTKLINTCQQYGISIFFLNQSLKYYGEINSKAEGNYLLRQKQYHLTDDKCLEISKKIIKNKIINQLQTIKSKKDINVDSCRNLNELLGVEGSSANNYFQILFKDIGWYRRSPQTREDIPNFLLDIGYSFLFNYVDSILRIFGFDTYKGIYHQLFFQRKSLSCDLMEPMRVLIDKQIVKSYHLKQINEKDFGFKNGSFFFKKYEYSKKYRNIFLKAISDKKDDIYQYIYGFYRYMMNSQKYNFPNFKPC